MTTAQTTLATTTWKIDPSHTVIGFSARHLMVTRVQGQFREYTSEIEISENDPGSSRIRVEIAAASIDSGVQARDDHLRSADFFDVANFPTLTFESTRLERVSGQNYRLTGDLTIRGTTREVVLDVEATDVAKDPWGGYRVGASATTKIKRSDWGLTWNVALEFGGVTVSDEIGINIDLQLIRQ